MTEINEGRLVKRCWWTSQHGDLVVEYEKGEAVIVIEYGNGAMVPWVKAGGTYSIVSGVTQIELYEDDALEGIPY
jgi:hypothetical protein